MRNVGCCEKKTLRLERDSYWNQLDVKKGKTWSELARIFTKVARATCWAVQNTNRITQSPYSEDISFTKIDVICDHVRQNHPSVWLAAGSPCILFVFGMFPPNFYSEAFLYYCMKNIKICYGALQDSSETTDFRSERAVATADLHYEIKYTCM